MRELWWASTFGKRDIPPRYCPNVQDVAIIERRARPPKSIEALSSQGEAELERIRQAKRTDAGA